MRFYLMLLPLIAASACAQSLEARVAAGLQDAGLSPRMSHCMAERWVDRLNVSQLRRIQAVAKSLKRERGEGRLSAFQLVDHVARLDDPEILEVVSTSAARCALNV